MREILRICKMKVAWHISYSGEGCPLAESPELGVLDNCREIHPTPLGYKEPHMYDKIRDPGVPNQLPMLWSLLKPCSVTGCEKRGRKDYRK